MIKKSLFLLYALIITLSGSLKCNAQLTDAQVKELLFKIDDSIASIKTVVYKIKYDKKLLSRRDTVHTVAVCSLYIAPRDKMKAYNIIDGTETALERHSYIHRKYDGKRSFLTDRSVDFPDKLTNNFIESDSKMRESVVKDYGDLLLSEYTKIKTPFGRYAPSAGMIGFKEDKLYGVPVYVFTITFKDKEDVRDNVEKHYIRKSDLLPIAFSSFLRWENMEQYHYYEVDYLDINPNITREDFKIEKDETIVASERYNEFNKKIKK
ncbi:hypothetical protein R1T16_11490 [Flavobacterium sp. DG1-102-2]|uniref:hypothetical protein n=1 Tax=Flavobacterium sp. DG1-102-2 TaxID=3081663 RepID=UPI0029494B60|nr:hypothetical protein [Flavobacterium sp. DG1-102-2]MDV6169051.1 hypothetical protein [Flavobacterium sp. DG1-102-2]